MDSPAPPTPVSENPPTPAQGGGPGANLAPLPRTKSRVYGSQLAKEGDVQKYKVKYKDLKTKVREIEKDNDKLLVKIARAKKDMQRVRLERAMIYERLLLTPEPPLPTPQDEQVAIARLTAEEKALDDASAPVPPAPSTTTTSTGGGLPLSGLLAPVPATTEVPAAAVSAAASTEDAGNVVAPAAGPMEIEPSVVVQQE